MLSTLSYFSLAICSLVYHIYIFNFSREGLFFSQIGQLLPQSTSIQIGMTLTIEVVTVIMYIFNSPFQFT